MSITKYELSIEKGVILFRVWGSSFQKGYSTIEAVKKVTGKSLPGLRKHAAKLAKSQGVPFIDKTL